MPLQIDQENYQLFKIQPIINHLNSKFNSITMEECLSVNEQLCATKARNYLKQYLRDKPNSWGLKLFIF